MKLNIHVLHIMKSFYVTLQTVLGSILEDVTHLLHDAAVDDISSKWDRNAQQASSLRDKNNARTPQATASARNEDENPIGMGMQQALVDDNFVSSAAQVYTKPLSSVTDPVTGQPVLPPPYAQVFLSFRGLCHHNILVLQVMEVIDNLTLQVGPDGFTPRLSDDEITKLRFLGYYFPRRLDLCVTDEGRRCILIVGWTRLCLAVILFMTALWQVTTC